MTIQKVLHRCSLLLSFNPLWVPVRLQNSVWDFLGFYLGPGVFLGEFYFGKGVGGLIYVPIPTAPSLEIKNTPPPMGVRPLCLCTIYQTEPDLMV